MARIILTEESDLKLEQKVTPSKSAEFINERDLLKRRSKKYVELISGLDAHTLTETKGINQLMKELQEEFGMAALSDLPLGIVSKCFLGHPYEVHTLDLIGKQIIKHYKIDEAMEPDFEKARTVAKHHAYAMVEIYKDKMILIREDGSATKL